MRGRTSICRAEKAPNRAPLPLFPLLLSLQHMVPWMRGVEVREEGRKKVREGREASLSCLKETGSASLT